MSDKPKNHLEFIVYSTIVPIILKIWIPLNLLHDEFITLEVPFLDLIDALWKSHITRHIFFLVFSYLFN